MKIWLIYDRINLKKNEWYSKEYERLAKEKGVLLEVILSEDLTLILDQTPSLLYCNQPVILPDIAIVRTINYKLSYHLEQLKVRVANPAEVSRICNDKGLTYELAAKLGIPFVPTILCERKLLSQRLQSVSYPAVIKTVDGHGGKEVFLLKSYEESKIKEILADTTSDFVIQPLYGTRHEDLRVYVLGERIVAAVLRHATSEFKSNFSLGGEVRAYPLSEQEQELVKTISKAMPFDLVGIDFLIADDKSLVFNEIEDVVGARMLYQTSDINIAEEYLNYLLQLKQV